MDGIHINTSRFNAIFDYIADDVELYLFFQKKFLEHKMHTVNINVRSILEGIDDTESSSEGWWETSEGAKFGANKLAEVLKELEV